MSNISNSLDALFKNMENFVSTKTVVGEPIIIGDLTLVPLIDVSIGLGAAGGENGKNQSAGGLGAKITTAAVLSIKDGSVSIINVRNTDSMNKIIDMAPQVISNVSSFFNKKEAPYDSGFKSSGAGGDKDIVTEYMDSAQVSETVKEDEKEKIQKDFDFPVDVV